MQPKLASNFTENHMPKNKYMQYAYITKIIYDNYSVKSITG